MLKLYASIDIGTNSALLLIASFEDGKLIPRLEKIAEPRTGRGLRSTGKINLDSVDILSKCLIDFRQTICRVGARLAVVAGTQILREARNGEEVLKKISITLGHPCDILSGEIKRERPWRA